MTDLHSMSVEDALAQADKNLAEMRETNERELADIEPDTAFELGYETALHDLRRYLAPPSFEVGITIVNYETTGEDS